MRREQDRGGLMKRCIRLIVSIALAAMAGAVLAQAASAPERAASSAGPAAAASAPAAGKLYAPLTQLDTWPLRIFVSRDIDDPSPKLKLYFADGVVNQPAYCEIVPVDIARHQVWVGGGSADGQDAQHVGTWLLFHLKPDRGRTPAADGSDARAAPYVPAAASAAGAARRLGNCSVPWLKPMARVQAAPAWSDAACRACAARCPSWRPHRRRRRSTAGCWRMWTRWTRSCGRWSMRRRPTRP